MKRYTLWFLLITSPIVVLAQSGFNYHQFSIGAGAGTTTGYGSTQSTDGRYAYSYTLSYNPSPFSAITLEVQEGTIVGGFVTDPSQRRFVNDFTAVFLHTNIQIGELVDYSRSAFFNGLKNAYFGTGVGFIHNNMSFIQLGEPAGQIDNSTGIYSYYPTSVNFIVPVRIGYEFKMYDGWDRPRYRLDIGYSLNYAFGEGFDGYADYPNVKYYTYLHIGFKVGLGSIGTYHKPINPYF